MTQERYVLERQVGVGGMGDVWLATDTLLNRPVAVKFLQSGKDARLRDLFLSEARTLASLQHPNITLIYDAVFDDTQNRFYIIMEYAEGQSISSILRKSDAPMPLDTVVKIATGVLQALSYAHNKGFVHRDIKPENILIHNDSVKLTDFGLAGLASLLNQQNSNYIAGTPPYMSPEQIAGEAIDGRADLYSLGVTLFEMLTGGRRPFEREFPQDILTAHIEDEPPSVREFQPTVPLQLERIIARLLAKYPDERYESSRELLDIFTGLQARQKFSQGYLQFLGTSAHPLVGRDPEIKQLNSVWHETQQSKKSRLVIVSGEAGVGRSRLIAEFLGSTLIDQNVPALAGRCDELGAAYTPYAEILASIFEKGLVKPATIESHISYLTGQLPSLAQLLNLSPPRTDTHQSRGSGLWQTLSSRLPNAPTDDPAQAQQQHFFTAVSSIFAQLGACAIYLNDASNLDEDSLALTRFLLRQTQTPLLIIAELNATEGRPAAWPDTFSADEKETIALSPLPPDDIRRYMEQLLEGPVSDAVVRVVEKRSRGVPQQIDELTRHLTDMGDFYRSDSGEWEYLPPPATGDLAQGLLSYSLTSAFTRQLDKLAPEHKAALTTAALIETGPEFELDVWLGVLSGEAEREVARQALDHALQRRIIRQTDAGRFAFRPADIATALMMMLPAEERRDQHKTIAQALQSQIDNPTLIGYHFEQAGLPTQAARYLETAGQRAAAANDISRAIDCYKRVANLVESVSGLEALGDLYRQQGAWPESLEATEKALRLARQSGDADQQARLLNGLAFTLWLTDKYRDAAQHASAVLKLEAASVVEHAAAQTHLGMISWLLGHLPEAEEWCRKAVNNLQGIGEQPRLAEAYNRLGLVYFTRGKFAKATEVTRRSYELRHKAGNIWGEAYCQVGLGQIEADQGHFDAAAGYFATARGLFEQINSTDGLMVVNTEEGRALLLQKNYAEAITSLKKALTMAQEIDKRSAYGLGDIYLLLAETSLQLDDFERAATAAQDALGLVEPAGNKKYVAVGQAILAQVYAARGEFFLADEMFKKAFVLFDTVDNPAGRLRAQLRYAQFLAARGNTETAAQLEQQVRQQAAEISLHL